MATTNPAEVRAAWKLNQNLLRDKMVRFLGYQPEALLQIVRDPESMSCDVIIARMILEAAKGNVPCAQAIFDRAVGKVKDQVEISLPKPMIVENYETGAQTLLAAKVLDSKVVEGVEEIDIPQLGGKHGVPKI